MYMVQEHFWPIVKLTIKLSGVCRSLISVGVGLMITFILTTKVGCVQPLGFPKMLFPSILVILKVWISLVAINEFFCSEENVWYIPKRFFTWSYILKSYFYRSNSEYQQAEFWML